MCCLGCNERSRRWITDNLAWSWTSSNGCFPKYYSTPVAKTATCASQRVETLADFHRGFHALFDTTITYKAFYNQLAKPHFADFARTMTSRLIGDMTLQVFGFEKGRPFGEFRHIILQDGSSFAIHDGLREVLPRNAMECVKTEAWSVPRRANEVLS